MRHMNPRVVIAGAILLGLAALFFLGMLTVAPKSNDPAAMMRTVGRVAGAAGGLGVFMIIFGLIIKRKVTRRSCWRAYRLTTSIHPTETRRPA